jgi:hypothetical protein
MKYIVLDHYFMYLFPCSDSHDKFLHCLNSSLKCTSAGFVRKGVCCGESLTLGITSSPGDTALFNHLMDMEIVGLEK